MSRVRSIPSRRLTLAVVLLGGTAVTATITILTIAIPTIARDLGASVTDTAWVLLAPIVVSALASPGAGRAADLWGRKRLWLIGFSIATVGVVAAALAPSLAVLIGARVITGVGTALALPAGLAIAVGAYDRADQGVPLGWWTSTTALSPAAGVLIGGVAVEYMSWRWLFYGQIPLTLAALIMGWWVFREQRQEGAPRFDGAGAVLGGAVVFSLLLAVNRGAVWGWSSPAILACGAVVVVGLPWFISVERRAESPVLPFSLLRNPVILWAVLNRAFVHAAYMGSFVIIPVMFIEVGHWGPAAVALALVPRPIALGVTGPIAGALTKRVRPERLVIAGSLALALGTAVLAQLTPSGTYILLAAALVAMGVGLGLSGTAASTMVTSRTQEAELGAVSGFLGVVSSLSNSLGMAVMISVVTIAGGEAQVSAYHWSFGVGAGFAALGALTAFALARASRASRQ